MPTRSEKGQALGRSRRFSVMPVSQMNGFAVRIQRQNKHTWSCCRFPMCLITAISASVDLSVASPSAIISMPLMMVGERWGRIRIRVVRDVTGEENKRDLHTEQQRRKSAGELLRGRPCGVGSLRRPSFRSGTRRRRRTGRGGTTESGNPYRVSSHHQDDTQGSPLHLHIQLAVKHGPSCLNFR